MKIQILTKRTFTIVFVLGCIPGIAWKIFGRYTNWYAGNQIPSDLLWHDLFLGLVGPIVGIGMGYMMVKWIKRWIKEKFSSIVKSLAVILFTFLSGSVAFSSSMALMELIGQLLGWCINCSDWLELILLIPLGLIWYSFLNFTLIFSFAVLNGVIYYFYLMFENRQ
jgi:hypothetical protein